jgi:hypothetical protein
MTHACAEWSPSNFGSLKSSFGSTLAGSSIRLIVVQLSESFARIHPSRRLWSS